MSDAVKKIFDEISPTYDRLNHLLSFNIDKSWRKKAVRQIDFATDQNLKVLDVCAGTHDFGLACLERFPNAQIEAVDFSPEMLKVGQQKLERLQKTASIHAQTGDALQLPFADNSFDVVLCAYGVRNFDNTQTGLREMWRVLKPGGQALILEFFRPIQKGAQFFSRTYGEYILPCCGQMVSGHKSAYSYLKNSIRGFLSIPEFTGLLQEIGFAEVRSKSFLLGISSWVTARKPHLPLLEQEGVGGS